MAISNYAILKGTTVAGKIFQPRSPRDFPHYHIHVVAANGAHYDIAVNIRSMDGSEVLYHVTNGFNPPNAAGLKVISNAITHPDRDLALDFVRTPGLVTRDQMVPLPVDETEPNTKLHSAIDDIVQKAIAQKATIYAFGQTFRNGTSSASPFWGFKPDQGIHDIHMNQGNPNGAHSKDNGTFQDGALLFNFPDGTWSAVLIAFQSQSWNTDDQGDAR